jgi:hypothetical protein
MEAFQLPSRTNIVATETHSFSPSVVNEFRFGYLHQTTAFASYPQSSDIYQKLGISGIDVSIPSVQSLYGPGFTFGGTGSVVAIGGWPYGFEHFEDKDFLFNETITMIRGPHTLRFGFGYERFNEPTCACSEGANIAFTGSNSPVSTGNAFADFLLDAPSSGNLTDPYPLPQLLRRDMSAFALDDWKVTPKLTLNLGVRYDYLSPLSEANDRGLSTFDRATNSVVINSPNLPSGLPQRIGIGDGVPMVTSMSLGLGRSLQQANHADFSPRLGLAWRPFGDTSTVFRIGYGIYYAGTDMSYKSWQTRNPPWAITNNYASDIDSRMTLEAPFSGGSTLLAPTIRSTAIYLPDEYMQQWNVAIERQISRNVALTVSYVGSQGTHLLVPLDYNQVVSSGRNPDGTLVTVRPVPELNSIPVFQAAGNRSYHSLQVDLRKRWSSGFQLDGNWTWAKSIDDSLDQGSSPQNSRDLEAERADSGYTLPHVLNIVGIYELPFGQQRRFLGGSSRLVDAVIGGWALSGVYRLQSGGFYTPSFSNAFAAFGVGGSRPNRLAGVPVNSDIPAGLEFNPAAFSAPTYNPDVPEVVYGNSARNVIHGPSWADLDLSITKSLHVWEKQRLFVQAEAFNSLNTVNIQGFNTNISDAVNVGRPTSAGAARSLQFALRYEF